MDFNPRSREGSDFESFHFTYAHTISIRAPAKGATGDSLINALSGDISIRAPAKGATILSILFFPFYDISIRAPAKGATNCAWATEWSEWNFNPRSREGSDCLNRSISLTLIPFQSALPRRERLYSILLLI